MAGNKPKLVDLIGADVPSRVVQRVLDDAFVCGHVEVAQVWASAEPAAQTIVVPVFNQEHFIRKCLAGISGNITTPSDLVVILDFCTDRSESAVISFLEEARACFCRITVLRATCPIFETRCDNLGFLLSRGDHVIEVQSDIEVQTPGFDALLKAPMQHAPEIFSTSGRGGTWFGQLLPRRERKKRFPIRTRLWERMGWDRIGYTGASIVDAAHHAGSAGAYARAETVMRGPWCLRRRDLVDLGLLDEKNFFLSNDDHDLHARAWDKGLRCGYAPMRFNSPLNAGSTRQPRSGVNLEVYERLMLRPSNGYLATFLADYRPNIPCRYVRGRASSDD